MPFFITYFSLDVGLTNLPDDYCLDNQMPLPSPFNSDELWHVLPNHLGMDLVNNRNTILFEPTALMLFQLMTLEPNKGIESFVMIEVLDSYLHIGFSINSNCFS